MKNSAVLLTTWRNVSENGFKSSYIIRVEMELSY